MPELVIAKLDGTAVLRVDLTNREKFTIGRSSRCDVQLKASGISRRHALLVEEAGRWVIIDTYSRNGVWRDGQRVHTAVLDDETPIRIGPAYLWLFGLKKTKDEFPDARTDRSLRAQLRTELDNAGPSVGSLRVGSRITADLIA